MSVGRQLKPFPQHLADSRIGARSEFQPNHGFVAALADLFLDQLAESRCRIVIDLDFRVAGETYQRGGGHRHAAIEFVDIAANDFVQRNEQLLPRVRHPCRDGTHCFSPPGTLTRAYIDSPLAGSRSRKISEVDRFERKGNGCSGSMTRGVRAGDRLDSKYSPRFLLLARGQFVPAAQSDAMLGQTRNDRLAVALRLPPKLREQFVSQPLQQSALCVGVSLPQHRHALHEKLIEVRGKDGEELGPFQQRRALVESLGQRLAR